MPGKMYPKERVASTKYESGSVKHGNKPVSKNGTESFKPHRAGKTPSTTGTTNPPKRAGSHTSKNMDY